jgi:hypothetical protein
MVLLAAWTMAWAAPSFEGPADDVALAAAAWGAAVDCTGREPAARSTVTITRGGVVSPWAGGVASSGAGGLRSIALSKDANAFTLAHEIAHAWFHGGLSALDEGRANLLASCVAATLGHPSPACACRS